MIFYPVTFCQVWILVKSQTDIQKVMHMSPPCIRTGVLKNKIATPFSLLFLQSFLLHVHCQHILYTQNKTRAILALKKVLLLHIDTLYYKKGSFEGSKVCGRPENIYDICLWIISQRSELNGLMTSFIRIGADILPIYDPPIAFYSLNHLIQNRCKVIQNKIDVIPKYPFLILCVGS